MSEKVFFTLAHGERKTELVRFQIVQATIATLHEGGGENLSFEAIGKKVGLSRGLVKHYFPDKDDLIDLCLTYISAVAKQITKEKVEKTKSQEERIFAYCDASFKWARMEGYTSAIMFLYYRATHNKKMKALHSQLRLAGTDRIFQLLKTRFPSVAPSVLQDKAQQIYFTLTSLLIEECTTTAKGGKEKCRVLVKDILQSIS